MQSKMGLSKKFVNQHSSEISGEVFVQEILKEDFFNPQERALYYFMNCESSEKSCPIQFYLRILLLVEK